MKLFRDYFWGDDFRSDDFFREEFNNGEQVNIYKHLLDEHGSSLINYIILDSEDNMITESTVSLVDACEKFYNLKHKTEMVELLKKFIQSQKDMPPEFSKLLDDNIWELLL